MTAVSETAEAGALFTAYRDRIRRYIVGLVRDPAEAEDLTQETFLRAHRQQETLRDPKAARGWLYRIATHVSVDHLRIRGRQVALDLEEETQPVRPAVVESPSAQERVERAETSACVQRCLDYLPDSYRAVILLFEAHGLTTAEIAELLGTNVGTVKIRLHRARRRLQDVMEIGCAVSGSSSGVPCCEPRAEDGTGLHKGRQVASGSPVVGS